MLEHTQLQFLLIGNLRQLQILEAKGSSMMAQGTMDDLALKVEIEASCVLTYSLNVEPYYQQLYSTYLHVRQQPNRKRLQNHGSQTSTVPYGTVTAAVNLDP